MKLLISPSLTILLLILGSSSQTSQKGSTGKAVIFAIDVGRNSFFMNEQGGLLFGKQFEEVRTFSEGFAAVEQNGKWGFINTTGEEVISCIYDWADSFSEGLAEVKLKGQLGYIDTKGEFTTCKYESIYPLFGTLSFILALSAPLKKRKAPQLEKTEP